MGREGHIKLYRQIQDNPLWSDKPFARGQAWIDLLMMANFADGTIIVRGQTVSIKRGEIFASLRFLADKWGWSTKKVKAYVQLLEKLKMVTQKETPLGTLITIENYNFYQSGAYDEETQKETQRKRRGNAEETIHNKNKKNNKNKYIENTPDLSDFSPDMQKAITDWLTYKDERKESYKPTGLKSWISQVRKHSKSYEDKYIIEVIEKSMSCQYKGVVWDWLQDKPKRPKVKEPEPPPKVIPESERLTDAEREENLRRMREKIGGMF